MGQNIDDDDGEIMHGANMQIDDKIRKSVARTVDLMKRRKNLNDEIKEEREQMEKIGVHPRAYQDEVRNFKLYDESERALYMASRRRMQEVLAPVEESMFAEEIAERKKKAERKAAKDGNKPRTPAEIDAANADNPRSDPNAGGAKPQVPPEPPAGDWPDDKAVAERDAAEEMAGDAVLKSMAPQTTKKQSQSAKAKAKLAAAGLN
jgi:hypothetical protein